jgi:hypothetical protein
MRTQQDYFFSVTGVTSANKSFCRCAQEKFHCRYMPVTAFDRRIASVHVAAIFLISSA